MKRHIFIAVLTLLASPALAQVAPVAAGQDSAISSEQPVEISAAKSLEWDRNAKTYTARGQTTAKQGDFQVDAETLTARYDDAGGQTDIDEMTATGSVIITSPPYRAFGDKAVYNVKNGNAVLTGKDLRIETEGQRLTARDKVEFFAAENRMVATGNAVATRATDQLSADVLNGYFATDVQGRRALTKVTGKGNVVVQTAKETIHGDDGTYDIPAQKALITGKVRILQGKSWLEGNRATVDLQSGISQLFAGSNAATPGSNSGRVKGVFYPKKQEGSAQQP